MVTLIIITIVEYIIPSNIMKTSRVGVVNRVNIVLMGTYLITHF